MENNKVLAKVGNREVTQKDLNFFLQNLDPQSASQFQSPEGQKRLLTELINQELFYLEAKDQNLDEDQSFVQSLEQLKENYLKQFAITKLLANVSITEDEIKKYYKENQDQFITPKSVQAKHILVQKEEDAQNILQEIKEGSICFEEAAKKYSTCPSKARGGDLGYFHKGQMVPEFEKAAFNMEKEDISDPIKTQFGYHIIKLIDKKEQKTRDFEEVKPELEQMVLRMKQQEVYLKKIEELKKNYLIEMVE
ncbi:peptidylprolyl isomerase [Garciella nitratireducens]|uniref:Peptidyl-prolyl cis-trans isomerase C n=1 Tax=Garciella nitratireducens DSM 15102 TaxID=1121911 RepID=A0A1T4MAT4_9FIRM|nr:peptidylprolyl isomerase [Garciella nitratireducens]RBP37430.1 peptidyl-prolyl cis-trans isomerase C [Garciella nitratireducens]SJZ64129.1 peptidyl-prolyl cis-trans isomerase C [Garciella nitratireducens DSM 15102]